jgi:hypothetical protein
MSRVFQGLRCASPLATIDRRSAAEKLSGSSAKSQSLLAAVGLSSGPVPTFAVPMLRRSSLCVTQLEDRMTPATVGYSAGTLTVTADPGSTIVVSEVLDLNMVPTGQLVVADKGINLFITPGNQLPDALIVKPKPGCQDFTLSVGTLVSLNTVTVTGAPGSTKFDLFGNNVVTGNLTFSGTGAGNDTINIHKGLQIGGNATIDLKDGDNVLWLDGGVVDGQLSVAGGSGKDVVELGFSDQVMVKGNARFNLGNGSNWLSASAGNMFRVDKDLIYKGGSGDDTTDFEFEHAPVLILGNLNVNFGAANTGQNLWKTEKLEVKGNAKFHGGSSSDTVALTGPTTIYGKLALNLLGGPNRLDLAGGSVGQVNYVGGAGQDAIHLAADNGITVVGSFAATMGNGLNSLSGDGPYQVVVGTNFAYTGGADDDTVSLAAFGTNLYVKGDATAALGGGGKNVFKTWASKSLTVNGHLAMTSAATLGTSSIFLHGTNTFGTLSVNLGNGSNTFTIDGPGPSVVKGGMTYSGGAGNDEVNLDRLTVDADLNIAVGASPDFDWVRLGVSQDKPVAVHGNATIVGTGKAVWNLNRLQIDGDLTVTTGKFNDLVQMDDGLVSGSATFHLGGGNDELDLDRLTSLNGFTLPGATLIGGNLTVDAGAGADTVDLSSISGDGVNVTGKVKLIGGAGLDTFHNKLQNQFTGKKSEDFELGDSL